jgi:hypothetical protein
MHHVAILKKANIKKEDDALGDIVAGTKTIESRWYVNKVAPWDKLATADVLYLKQSGGPVVARAEIKKVLQYENLTSKIVENIIDTYGKQIAPHTSKAEFLKWAHENTKKRFCILVFLQNVTKIEPFDIDKTGYGSACAWLITENIEKIKRN